MSKLIPPDVYYKKDIPFNFARQRLTFRTSQALFSSHDIDVGTKFLLRTIVTADHIKEPGTILDLGCGYGPIGVTLKHVWPSSSVHMTDRDALAVDYAGQNIVRNGIDAGAVAYASLGYDDLRLPQFDLIVSNIPGKAGEPVLTDLLLDAGRHLAPGGTVAIVVVAPLEPLVARVLAEDATISVLAHERRANHAVFHYRFANNPSSGARPGSSALDRGVYRRETVNVSLDRADYTLETAFGLPEFDSTSYQTDLLIEAVTEHPGRGVKAAVVFNPGQGHVPAALHSVIQPERMALVDRDLLALRISQQNLVRNGCSASQVSVLHRVGHDLPEGWEPDVIVGLLREDEGQEAVAASFTQAANVLSKPAGRMIVAGSSTAVTRLATFVQERRLIPVVSRKRRFGYSVLVLGAG